MAFVKVTGPGGRVLRVAEEHAQFWADLGYKPTVPAAKPAPPAAKKPAARRRTTNKK